MLLNHSIVKKPPKKDFPQGFLWGNNGIFRSVERTEFQAIVPHASIATPGLAPIKTEFRLRVPKVPKQRVKAIIKQVNQYPNLEQLFYLYWRGTGWEVVKPEQECTPSSCLCLEQFPEPASIEIHSHGSMGAFFSSTDDAEETGCRISSVVGRNSDCPKGLASHRAERTGKANRLEIISRVCVHGLFAIVDSAHVYEGVEDYCYVKYS